MAETAMLTRSSEVNAATAKLQELLSFWQISNTIEKEEESVRGLRGGGERKIR